ncbi:MAG: N-acetyl-gamma-glutamyl-phosphate reductase [Bacteroidota bacterium]
MIKTGIIGAAGYSGLELIKLLLDHPEVEITRLFGFNSAGNRIDDVHPLLRGLITNEIHVYDEKLIAELDLLFIALPSGNAFPFVIDAYEKGIRVIDLGGDFRLNNINDYKTYYKHEHTAPGLANIAVYGLSELNEQEIKNAAIVANPGCYSTSILLPLVPLLKENIITKDFISIVSYSGTSGAGKSVTENMMFSEVNESVRAYKIGKHQHIPEITRYLLKFGGSDPNFSFVPHLLPITRGIYTTIQTKVNKSVNENLCINLFTEYYSDSPFVRIVHPDIPEIKNVSGTNFCDIGCTINNGIITIISTIDNLIKGAAGQAIQNMNIMFRLEQTEGILKCSKKQYLKVQSI